MSIVFVILAKTILVESCTNARNVEKGKDSRMKNNVKAYFLDRKNKAIIPVILIEKYFSSATISLNKVAGVTKNVSSEDVFLNNELAIKEYNRIINN